jgi:hypothetical protein
MMVSCFERWTTMEAMGILDPTSHVDLFCLHRIFLPIMQVTMDLFYEQLRGQMKSRSTKNPNYPAGAF